jgi:hypothetical protein
MPNLENAVADKLGIKWVDAKRLVKQAILNVEIEGPVVPVDREEEVLEEACEIFEDLEEHEKAAMRKPQSQSNNSEEPEWKQKAIENAQRREAEWRAKENAVANNEKVRDKLRDAGVDEGEVSGTRVTSIKKLPGGPPEESAETGKGVVRVRTHRVCCVIM